MEKLLIKYSENNFLCCIFTTSKTLRKTNFLYFMQTLEQLIEKYSSRLKVMKENLANEIDELDDATTNQYLKEISLTAEISRDLKSLLNKTVWEENYIEILGFKETSPYRFDKMKFPFFGKIVKNRLGQNDLDPHGNITFLDENGEEWSTYHFITN